MSASKLEFGIEMELYLRPKHPGLENMMKSHGCLAKGNTREQDRKAFRMALTDILEPDIPTQCDVTGNYLKWTVADEDLDETEATHGYFPCEIVSRVLDSDGNWDEEIDNMFNALLHNYDLLLTRGCAMHVHVSPHNGTYTLSQLQSILKAALYYERALAVIMPAERKDTPWAEPNMRMIRNCEKNINKVPQTTWAPVFNEIDNCKFIPTLLAHVNCSKRQVSWNFSNVVNPCGTVEFRRPPGVKSAADAKHWAALTMGFVAEAMRQDWKAVRTTKTHPSTDTLRSVITRGARSLGSPVQAVLNPMLMADINMPATVLSVEERQKIKQKIEKKAKKHSVFVENVINSRPNTPVGHK
ncbi:uncharacterized protein GIQ15_06633 [Arthroderma uncinatum]|uniref:uncharacterized protein n=1 Tax=Arthroderma uncinatum TaxID=74035 RepID=UPI00144A5751|nr:uncharacterized protein GIQ15_06633 [Arthroderma uncinatum]KAF3479657.1 hypothetical protein GIQ15_06633 [Arthroderma uncinatum]